MPADLSARSVFRFRRGTEPWALDAAKFVGAEPELTRAIEEARARDLAESLLRGENAQSELGRLAMAQAGPRPCGRGATPDVR